MCSRSGGRIMFGELVPCGGGAPIALAQETLVVGRKPPADIVLRDGTISSRHCQLQWTDGYWFVTDLESRNGTRVNGAVCRNRCLLPGDVLSVAKVRLRINYKPQSELLPADAGPREGDAGAIDTAEPQDESGPGPAGRVPRATPALAEMVPCGGGETIPLRKRLVAIGRDRECDVVVRCASVSARHCELEFKDGYWWVRDLKSRNGVRVDGVKQEEACLKPNKLFAIGRQRYFLSYQAPPEELPPEKPPSLLKGLLGKAAAPRREPEPASHGARLDKGAKRPAAAHPDDEPRRRWSLDDPDAS
jgi:pSer/pThr/pTyr-binding forkhead associated (FHA) protein